MFRVAVEDDHKFGVMANLRHGVKIRDKVG
jgi:hypothetical protein